MAVTKTWTIEGVSMLDNYYQSALTVEEYVSRGSKDSKEGETTRQKAETFLSALDAVRKDSRLAGEFRNPIGVIYNPNNDDVAFVFKLYKWGTTFIVSKNGMIINKENIPNGVEKIKGNGDLTNDSQMNELKALGITEI